MAFYSLLALEVVEMDRFGLRVGAAFGWVAFLGVAIGLIAIPMAIAGQPPTFQSTIAEARAYFGHQELAVVNVLSPLIAIALIPFGFALRNALRLGDERGRFAADVALIALIVTAPLYVISSSIGAALAGEAARDSTSFEALFRLHSILYDSAADFLEGTWIGAFGLATLAGPGRSWLGWLGVAVGLSRWVKALAPVIVVPDVVVLVGGIAFLVWFAWTVVRLSRQSMAGGVATTAATALAASR